MTAAQTLELLDWKRRVFSLYAAVRALEPEAGWELWRETRDELFRFAPAVAAARRPPHVVQRARLLDYDPQAPRPRRARGHRGAAEPVETSGDGADPVPAVRHARASSCGASSSRWSSTGWSGYGGGALPAVPRRDERAARLRRRPLRPRHGEGSGSRRRTADGSCSTSTSPTTRPARTTPAGSARWRRRRTGCRSRWKPASGTPHERASSHSGTRSPSSTGGCSSC